MKVLCVLTDGFEELEAVGTIALLRRAGITIDVYALDAKQATGRFQINMGEIKDIVEANVEDYGILFYQEGLIIKLEADARVMAIIDHFASQNKFIAAICAAPTILGRHGLLKENAIPALPV